MSTYAPITHQDDWFIGEDKVFEHRVGTGAEIVASGAAANGATSLPVRRLKEALFINDKIRFGNVVATVDTIALVGATSVGIASLVGNIYRNDKGEKVLNIAAMQFEWVLRTSAEAAAATFTKTTGAGEIVLTDAANGVLAVTILDDDTVNLAPAKYVYACRRTDAGSEGVVSHGEAVLRRTSTR